MLIWREISYLNNTLKPYVPLRALRSSNMDLLTVPRPVTSLGPRRFSLKGYSGKKNELAKTILAA